MSRTDRHRPWQVQVDDPYELRFVWWDQGTPKHGWRKVFLFRDCNCRTYWCCATKPNRHERRASRHDAQRRCRAAVKGDFRD